MEAPQINPLLSAEIKRMKGYFPFRIVWGYMDGPKPVVFANHTKRQMNAAMRQGHMVYSTQTHK